MRVRKVARQAEREAIFKVVQRLKSEGWRVQRWGMVCLNGTLATSLLKDGQVIRLSQDLYPDQEEVKESWPRRRERQR
jgi:hypothetical protein